MHNNVLLTYFVCQFSVTESYTDYSLCLWTLYSYVMFWKGGYQDKDEAISASTTKLKGIALTNSTELNITVHGGVDGNRIWDVADYVMPPQVNYFAAQYVRFSEITITIL